MNRTVALLGVLAALALVFGVGTATAPGKSASVAGGPVATVAVVGAQVICPSLRSDLTTGQRSSASAASPPAPAAIAAAASGTLALAPLSGAPSRQDVPLASGEVTQDVGTDLTDDALVVTARGAVAAGLEVEQRTQAATGPERGLTGLRCEAARTDLWFAGGSVAAGAQAVLVLVNPDEAAAVVDLQVWSAEGDVDPRLGRGLVVPARGRSTVSLDTLAPGRSQLAVHATVTRGRVTAALLQTGGSAAGAQWVPRSPPPAARVPLAGLPAGPGRRAVEITNPGLDPTVVSLQVSAADGQFVPTGLDALVVPPGSTVEADLTALLAAGPGQVTVVSSVGPVLAVGVAGPAETGSAQPAGGGSPSGVTYASATTALSAPALVADAETGPSTQSTLLLTAPGQDASVVLTPLAVAGTTSAGAPRTVAVPGGSTVELDLSTLVPQGRFGVLVQPVPGSGEMIAARLLQQRLADGTYATLLALESAPQTVTRPAVAADAAAGLPR